MLINIVDKQRRAVSAVKMALLGVGITGRAVCVTVNNWDWGFENTLNPERFAVFIASHEGTEPFYETGETIVEAVRNTINAIKDRSNGTASADEPEAAPF
ncbi:MAG: hypothetical protein D4R98_03420 [Comamonadaceae bacterium]|nr:MAG: hypothetical protein D4R98_03420 [Comamonadaceae bacterium]